MPRRSHVARPRSILGLTLIESMLAMAVLEVAVLAVAAAMTAGGQHAEYAEQATKAVELSEQLIEQILALPYEDPDGASAPGPESNERSRASFDNTDDYHGFSDRIGITNPPTTFTRTVDVSPRTENVRELRTSITGQVVTVTVRNEDGDTWGMTRFIPEDTP